MTLTDALNAAIAQVEATIAQILTLPAGHIRDLALQAASALLNHLLSLL